MTAQQSDGSVDRPERSDSDSASDPEQLRRGELLVVWGLISGIAALVLCLVAGYVSYRLSRKAHIESISRYNRVVSQQLVQSLRQAGKRASTPLTTKWIMERWNELPRSDSSVYMCLIDRDGKLAAHSLQPDKAGSDVSGIRLTDSSGKSQTIPDLLNAKTDWVGENTNLRGKRQIAAYTYSDELEGLVVIHTPAETYEADIRSAAMPWMFGFGIATLGLVPACVIFTSLAFRFYHKTTREAQRHLKDQFVELEQFYRAAPVGLCLVDTQLRFLRLNETMAMITGIPIENHVGKTIDEISPDLATHVEPIYRRILKTGERELNHEFSLRDSSHHDRWSEYRASYHCVRAGDGPISGVSMVVQNVTLEKTADQERAQHALELAHASRLNTIGQMVAGIIHEINQPLSAISNYAAACSATLANTSTNSDSKINDWLDKIGQQAVRCGEIVKQLRGFVRKGDDSSEFIAVNDLVRESIALATADRRYPDVCVSTDLSEPSPVIFVCRVQFQQVIVNLLRNACDAVSHIASESPRVVVQAAADDKHVVISVTDNGPGVDPDIRSMLFDPFFTTKGEGMGIGLAICKSIVESSDGRLWEETPPQRGARFCIELPLAPR
ncbi:MAG: PAS domain-containing protein [Pirellulaceae bacterium]|nr:PAS domain-containing protein [Pirellulaceae bacterium]